MSGHQYWWLEGGYDLEIGHSAIEVACMVVTWWILAFCAEVVVYYTAEGRTTTAIPKYNDVFIHHRTIICTGTQMSQND